MFARVAFLSGLAVLGCGGGGSSQQALVKHASSTWQCPPSHVEVEQVDAEMYRVAGCQREATYTCSEGADAGCLRVSGL